MKKMKHLSLLALAFGLNSLNNLQAQVDWTTITAATEDAKTNLVTVVGHIVGIIIAVAFAYTLWKVATGKQDSKESLMALGGGLAIYIIAIALGFLS